MLRIPLAAAVVLGLVAGPQDLPVTRLAGGAAGQAQPQPQPPAQPPQPPRPGGLPATQLDPGASAVTLDSPRRLSLYFNEPRPIEEVMQLLVAGTRFSLAIDPDVGGSFRGGLKDLTLREALTTLLTPLGLDFEVRGTVIYVTRHREETRSFDLNLLNVQRTLTRWTGEGNATLQTSAPGEDVFAGIEAGVRTLLSGTGRVHVDRRAGLAQVTDVPERLDRVALYLEALHVRSHRQVRLEARVFEVMLRTGATIDWRAVREKLGLAPNATDAGLAADPAALRDALAAQGDIRPLSAPEVTAMNNEPALMRVATGGESSLTLTVVPQIASDGIVQLSVSHSWEEHAGTRSSGWLKSTPFTRTAESDTVTRVADGRTVVISGLLRQTQVVTESKRVGALFGAQSKKTAYAELVVLLRPVVVTPGTQATGNR